jgi:cysteine desulfuration protein SufE
MMTDSVPPIEEVIAAFDLIDDWEERYRYVIELGRDLPDFPEHLRTDANKVRGCVSQVWLATDIDGGPDRRPMLHFQGDSDALIVRGLIAILLSMFKGRTPAEIRDTDPEAIFRQLELREHLTPQRSNGLTAMIRRIHADAEAASAAA